MAGKPQLTALGLGVLIVFAVRAGAQTNESETRRVRTSIDYVSVDGLYLAVGSDDGAAVGDTVRLFADSVTAEPLGTILVASVTRRRSVARALTSSMALEAGAGVWVELPIPTIEPSAPVVAQAPAETLSRGPPMGRVEAGAQVQGRVSVEVDARQTRTSWSGDLFGETVRRFATPTTHLSLLASHLPGGFTVRANVRGSYRYDELAGGPPPLSVRAYELAAVRSFDDLPVQVMFGRFANPYESYSAYWDGVLLRLGRDPGAGLGVVAGFEPHLHDEEISAALPKLTAFADYSAGGRQWRYDTDVSVHLVRPGRTLALRSAGWSQRLSLGALDLTQRLRLNRATDGRWSVGDARLRASLELVGPLRLRATYGRLRAAPAATREISATLPGELGPIREEASVGIELDGRRAWVVVEAGGKRRDGTSSGLSLSVNARLAWDDAGIGMRAQRWSGPGAETLVLTPSLEAATGFLSWRASYRFYRTSTSLADMRSQTAAAELGFILAPSLHFTIGGERQWGENLSGTRVRAGVRRSF